MAKRTCEKCGHEYDDGQPPKEKMDKPRTTVDPSDHPNSFQTGLLSRVR